MSYFDEMLQRLPEPCREVNGKFTCVPGARCRDYYMCLVMDVCDEANLRSDHVTSVLAWLLENDLDDDKESVADLAGRYRKEHVDRE